VQHALSAEILTGTFRLQAVGCLVHSKITLQHNISQEESLL